MSKPIWTADRARLVLKQCGTRAGYLQAPLLTDELIPLLEAFIALDAIDRITHGHIDREALAKAAHVRAMPAPAEGTTTGEKR